MGDEDLNSQGRTRIFIALYPGQQLSVVLIPINISPITLFILNPLSIHSFNSRLQSKRFHAIMANTNPIYIFPPKIRQDMTHNVYPRTCSSILFFFRVIGLIIFIMSNLILIRIKSSIVSHANPNGSQSV
jgi:hypothetical protein